ncbi:MAG: hypothetical protein R6V52_06410 [Bacteroidales bacterium]
MHFEKGHLYHVYNQGNKRQPIFFERRNYFFFLEKMRTHLLPFGDLIAYCLMPNHFHWMMVVRKVSVVVPAAIHPMTQSHRMNALESHRMNALDAEKVTQSHRMNALDAEKVQSLNESIGILLRSYTRAINKEQECSGSLFRQKTKAECLTCNKGITPTFYDSKYGTKMNVPRQEKQYPQACFDYIHNNPVKAGLVKRAEDWEFSSYRNYMENRNGGLINKKATKEFGIIFDL